MRCPVCTHKDTKVVDSREAEEGFEIRRRRECAKCEYRFSTGEEVEILDLMVVKNDGARQPYLREKLISGLRKALEKRPYTLARFKRMVGAIERDVQKKKNVEITSNDIGEIVMQHLRKFDGVAYVRFASVYRSFEDIKEFQEALQKVMPKHRIKSK